MAGWGLAGFWLGAASWALFPLQSGQAEANCASLARGGLACQGASRRFEQEPELVPPRRYSVVVITSDSESVDPSSNLGSASSFFVPRVLLRDGALWASRDAAGSGGRRGGAGFTDASHRCCPLSATGY